MENEKRTNILIEALDLSEATIDSESRVLKDVTLIRAGRSANRRDYGEAVLQAAVPVFEGSKAYANHPSPKQVGDRSVRDLTGWYSNVRYAEGKLMADRHFLNTQAGNDVWAIATAIVKHEAPNTLAGLSIHAVGEGKMVKDASGEYLRVESIASALSVDDVATPAAGGTYALTAGAGDELFNAIIESMDYQQWFESFPAHVERHTKEVQKVRLEDETKRQLAEAGDQVKAAEDERDLALSTLQESEGELQSLKESNAKLVEEVTQLRREMALDKALQKISLPQSWKASLREQLLKESDNEWESIIKREIAKSKSGGQPRVAVSGAGQRVNTLTESQTPARGIDWNKVNTPADLKAALAQQRSQS